MLVPHGPAHMPIVPTSGPGVASGAQDWGAVAAACFLLKKWKITSAEQNGGCDSPGTAPPLGHPPGHHWAPPGHMLGEKLALGVFVQEKK